MSPSSYQISRHIEEHVYDTSAVLVGFVLCNFKPQREGGGGERALLYLQIGHMLAKSLILV
jgi:hypothetical protein